MLDQREQQGLATAMSVELEIPAEQCQNRAS